MFKISLTRGTLFLGFGIVVQINRPDDQYICGLVICNLFIGFVSSIDLI